MRIIAGEFGGRTLKSTQSSMLRPTTDRVRESVFNMLATRIEFEGARVLDLYAGTGALGIEALSRGAEHCTFVEFDRRVSGVIADNLHALGITDRADVRTRDAMKFVVQDAGRYDLILVDPPYAAPVFNALVRALLAPGGPLADDGVLVVEHAGTQLLAAPEGATVVAERSFGDTRITIFSRA